MLPWLKRFMHDEDAFKMLALAAGRAALVGAGALTAFDHISWRAVVAALMIAAGVGIPSSAVKMGAGQSQRPT
jgi:hypothetical protein